MTDPDAALGAAAVVARAARLTPRQRQALTRYAQGDTLPELAANLAMAEKTVRNTLHAAYKRLGARNGPHAVWLMMRAQGYADHALAGDGGQGYLAALGAIWALLAGLGPMQAELTTLAAAVERLAQDAAKRPRHAP